MELIITSDVVVAYTQCPRKAFLLLFSPDKGEPHEYACILAEKTRMNRIAYLTKLQHEKPHIHAYDTETLAHGSDVLVEATLTAPGLEAYCDILMPVQTGSSRGKSLYVPTLLAGTHTITGEQKIAVGFAGYVLGQLH